MSLMQLPKVISVVNELSLKVQKLEIQVQTLLEDKAKQTKVNNVRVQKES